MHPEGNKEEWQVAYEEDQIWRAKIPPGQVPGQRAYVVKDYFDPDREQGIEDREKDAVIYAQYLHSSVRRQKLARVYSHDREHERYLDVQADQNVVGSGAGCRPSGSEIVEMEE